MKYRWKFQVGKSEFIVYARTKKEAIKIFDGPFDKCWKGPKLEDEIVSYEGRDS